MSFGSIAFTPVVKKLQERYGSRQQYQRVERSGASQDRFTAFETEFLTLRDSFYWATIGATGWPYIQHRGGPKGFLKVIDNHTLALADFRGNKQYISTGNLMTDNRVAMIMIDYPQQARLKILGHVEVLEGEMAAPWMDRVRVHWFFDHCETASDRNLERIRALGGGIAVQNRMAFQGEYFAERYGEEQTNRTPPIRRMLDLGIPVGAGTDATRVSSYNPFLALYWLITGKTIGGLTLYEQENRMSRAEALRLYTKGSSWFSSEEDIKGALAIGQFADLAVLSADFFSIPEEDIRRLESVLTITGGQVVYAAGEFSKLAPPALPVSPDWSPVKVYGGYATGSLYRSGDHARVTQVPSVPTHEHRYVKSENGLWSLNCDCFAF